MAKLLLFVRLIIGDIFHYYDTPDRKLVKSDRTHYIGPGGRRPISPTTAVIKDEPPKGGPTYLNPEEYSKKE